MGKKIRFPLKLSEGAEVRTLEELREHFDLEAILEYYKNGKLLTWLEDRYLEGEAEAVQALDEASPDFQRRLCEVFHVEYTGGDVDLEAIERRQERLKRLRSITDEAEYIQNIDRVAFDQEDLADLLDEGEERIYLCGEQFTVPASRKGLAYVGINNPTVHISGNVPEDAVGLGIEFVGIACDNLPQVAAEATDMCSGSTNRKGDVPDELLKDFQCRNISRFFETDNFYLYSRGYGEDIKWCCYEIATGQETVLTGKIAKGIDNTAGKLGGAFKISGDEVVFRREYDCWCSVDLRSLTLQRYDGMHFKNSQVALSFALSSNYLAVFSDNSTSSRDSTEECIEIYSRHNSLRMVHKIVVKRDAGFILNGEALNKNICQIEYFSSGRYSGSAYVSFFEDKLYFIVLEKKPLEDNARTSEFRPGHFSDWPFTSSRIWRLVCFDPTTGTYDIYDINQGFGPIAKAGKYLHLAAASGEDIVKLAALDMTNGAIQEITQFNGSIRQISDQYIIYEGKLADNNFYPYAIELSTCKLKKLPNFIVKGHKESNRLLLSRATLYWSHYTTKMMWGNIPGGPFGPQEGYENRSDFKYDLTEDPPKLVELES